MPPQRPCQHRPASWATPSRSATPSWPPTSREPRRFRPGSTWSRHVPSSSRRSVAGERDPRGSPAVEHRPDRGRRGGLLRSGPRGGGLGHDSERRKTMGRQPQTVPRPSPTRMSTPNPERRRWGDSRSGESGMTGASGPQLGCQSCLLSDGSGHLHEEDHRSRPGTRGTASEDTPQGSTRYAIPASRAMLGANPACEKGRPAGRCPAQRPGHRVGDFPGQPALDFIPMRCPM